MTSEPLHRPVPLESGHDLSAFDCGDQRLNDYLRKYALVNHQNRSARTYVAMRGERVVGFYTLAAGSVGREETPRRVAEGLGRYPVPVILLARLAVDTSEQGRGLGGGLLKDAILRAAQAADIIGVRALLTHAKDAAARGFYMHFGFEPSPVDDLHMYLLMKDVVKTLKR
jgi:GNAT superfamily N-acetyltransferase